MNRTPLTPPLSDGYAPGSSVVEHLNVIFRTLPGSGPMGDGYRS